MASDSGPPDNMIVEQLDNVSLSTNDPDDATSAYRDHPTLFFPSGSHVLYSPGHRDILRFHLDVVSRQSEDPHLVESALTTGNEPDRVNALPTDLMRGATVVEMHGLAFEGFRSVIQAIYQPRYIFVDLPQRLMKAAEGDLAGRLNEELAVLDELDILLHPCRTYRFDTITQACITILESIAPTTLTSMGERLKAFPLKTVLYDANLLHQMFKVACKVLEIATTHRLPQFIPGACYQLACRRQSMRSAVREIKLWPQGIDATLLFELHRELLYQQTNLVAALKPSDNSVVHECSSNNKVANKLCSYLPASDLVPRLWNATGDRPLVLTLEPVVFKKPVIDSWGSKFDSIGNNHKNCRYCTLKYQDDAHVVQRKLWNELPKLTEAGESWEAIGGHDEEIRQLALYLQVPEYLSTL